MNEDLTRQLLRRIAALERRLGIVETSEAGAAHSHAYSDHGNLTGLTDDDHTQYLLAAGTRALTADWDIGDGRKLIADVVRARDAAGLSLQDDGGNEALKILDGGHVDVGDVGTWSPTITGSTSDPTVTYLVRFGRYTYFGDVVFYSFFVAITSISGGSGDMRISLPIAPSHGGFNPAYTKGADHSGTPIGLTFSPTDGQTYGVVVAIQDNNTPTTLAIAGLANSDYIASTGFYFA